MQNNRGEIKLKNLGVAREMYKCFHLKFMQGRQANCSIKPWNAQPTKCSLVTTCLACQVVFEKKGFAREMVSNCNVGATTYTVCWVVFEWKGRIAPQAGHASPVKWCLNEKLEFLCKLAMPRLSSGVWKKRFCSGNGQQLQCWSYNVYGLLGGHWPRGSTGRRR